MMRYSCFHAENIKLNFPKWQHPPERFVPVLCASINSVSPLEGCDIWVICFWGLQGVFFVSEAFLFLTTCVNEQLLSLSRRPVWETDICCTVVSCPGKGLWHWSLSTDNLRSQEYHRLTQSAKQVLTSFGDSFIIVSLVEKVLAESESGPDLYLHICDSAPGEPSKRRWHAAVTLAALAFIVVTTDTLPPAPYTV